MQQKGIATSNKRGIDKRQKIDSEYIPLSKRYYTSILKSWELAFSRGIFKDMQAQPTMLYCTTIMGAFYTSHAGMLFIALSEEDGS
jgi:hypothetical protein